MDEQPEDSRLAGLTEDRVRQHIADAEEKAAAYQREAEGWRWILRGMRAVSGQEGHAGENSATAHPGNTSAVLRVMNQEPTRVWTARELYNALEDRGWLPRAADPRKSMGATLSVMTSKGRIDRVGRASYRLAPAGTLLRSNGGETD